MKTPLQAEVNQLFVYTTLCVSLSWYIKLINKTKQNKTKHEKNTKKTPVSSKSFFQIPREEAREMLPAIDYVVTSLLAWAMNGCLEYGNTAVSHEQKFWIWEYGLLEL